MLGCVIQRRWRTRALARDTGKMDYASRLLLSEEVRDGNLGGSDRMRDVDV